MNAARVHSVFIAVIFLVTTIVLNIFAIVDQHWYIVPSVIPGLDYQLMNMITCGPITYKNCHVHTPCEDEKQFDTENSWCLEYQEVPSEYYSHIATQLYMDYSKSDVKLVQAAGALAVLFLGLNIILCAILISLETGSGSNYFGEYIQNLFKRVQCHSLALATPFQIIAVFFWAALFPYYSKIPHFEEAGPVSLGSGLLCVIASVITCSVGWIIVWKLRQEKIEEKTPPHTEVAPLNKLGFKITVLVVALSIGLNVVAMSVPDWFKIGYKDTANYDNTPQHYFVTYQVTYGLQVMDIKCHLSQEPQYCNFSPGTYQELGYYFTMGNPTKLGLWERLRDVGNLTTAVLICNIFSLVALLLMEILSGTKSTQQYIPMWFNAVRTKICAIAALQQTLAMVIWFALFSLIPPQSTSRCYERYDCKAEQHVTDFMIGSCVYEMIASIGLCCVGFIFVHTRGIEKEETELPQLNKDQEMQTK